MESTIKIEANGDLKFLYHDDHPCLEMGSDLDIQRASNVRYVAGLWYVFMLDGVRLPQGHKRRADAIQYEIDFLEALLTEG